MGEARRKQEMVAGLPAAVASQILGPGVTKYVSEMLLFFKDEHDELMMLHAEYNEALVKAGKPPYSFNDFLRAGVIKRGVQAFKAAQAEYLKSKRMILLPSEVQR
jgi:hypothetical protein